VQQRNGFGIASLILGILAFSAIALAAMFSFTIGGFGVYIVIGFLGLFGIPVGLIAIAGAAFGGVGIARGRARSLPLGTAIWGTVLSSLVLFVYLVLVIITGGFGAWGWWA